MAAATPLVTRVEKTPSYLHLFRAPAAGGKVPPAHECMMPAISRVFYCEVVLSLATQLFPVLHACAFTCSMVRQLSIQQSVLCAFSQYEFTLVCRYQLAQWIWSSAHCIAISVPACLPRKRGVMNPELQEAQKCGVLGEY